MKENTDTTIDMSHTAPPKGFTKGASHTVQPENTPLDVVGASMSSDDTVDGLRVILAFFDAGVKQSKTISHSHGGCAEFDSPVTLTEGAEVVASTNNPSNERQAVRVTLYANHADSGALSLSKTTLAKCPACGTRWGREQSVPCECDECGQFLPEMRLD